MLDVVLAFDRPTILSGLAANTRTDIYGVLLWVESPITRIQRNHDGERRFIFSNLVEQPEFLHGGTALTLSCAICPAIHRVETQRKL